MGFFNNSNRQNKPLNSPSQPSLKPKQPLEKSEPKKEHPFLFPGSQEHIKGRGGLEDDLIRILRTEPNKVAELNRRFRSYGIPPIYSRDASKIAKEIIERRFSPEIRRDNVVRTSEAQSRTEKSKEYRKEMNLKKDKGYKEYNRERVMDEFFDDLLK